MAPFSNLFHPLHPSPPPLDHTSTQFPQSHNPQPQHAAHRPLRFLGQLIDDPYHAAAAYRARPRGHREVLAPDFDVRETEAAYFLEGEFPGIRDKEAIKLEWVDRRTLAIDARVVRTELGCEWGLAAGAEGRWPLENRVHGDGGHVNGVMDVRDAEMNGLGNGVGPQDEDGGPCVREVELERRKAAELDMARRREQMRQGQGGKPLAVRDWLAERRIGHFQRTFTFPADVDAVGVRARLGQGLLRILVPKVREAVVKTKQVDIENVE